GGVALDTLLLAAWSGWAGIPAHVWISFAAFWLLPVRIILNRLEGTKNPEGWPAPLLLAGGALLLGWAIVRGGGLGHILAESTRLQTGNVPFWQMFPAAPTPNSGHLALM